MLGHAKRVSKPVRLAKPANVRSKATGRESRSNRLVTFLCVDAVVFACRAAPKTLARGPLGIRFAALLAKRMVGAAG